MKFFLILLVPLLHARTIRVATYNVALSQNTEGGLLELLEEGGDDSVRRIAEVVQLIEPDVLLLNEFDYDAEGAGATLMNDRFLKVSQNGRPAQDFPYRYVAISNTGIHSGFDLDNNGRIDATPGDVSYGGDALGFGEFPGQYAMAVFSKFPINTDGVRTFEEILWKDLPGNLLPPGYYSGAEQEIFRISSKSHWDVPIQVAGTTFHLLASHPTPPVFDGSEDRNGRRNHDEIRLWADYLTPRAAGYLGGGLGEGKRFVIAGDQNADPSRGDSVDGAINQLLDHPRVNGEFVPERTGSSTAPSRSNTATFGLRVDYVLPSKLGFQIVDGAVFWPTGAQDGASLVTASDHRLVYLDLKLVPLIDEVVRGLSVETSAEEVVISWEFDVEARYRLERTSDLDAEDWDRLDEVEIEFSGDRAVVNLPALASRSFYRVVSFYE